MKKRSKLLASAAVLILAAGSAVFVFDRLAGEPLAHIENLPKFQRKFGDLTLNIVGTAAWQVHSMQYRLNGGDKEDVPRGGARIRKPLFCIEIEPAELKAGENTLVIESTGWLRGTERIETRFQYDLSAPKLPLRHDWSDRDAAQLEFGDGVWEVADTAAGRIVRPKIGFEDFDRLLIVSPTFSGPRRVETEVTFRHKVSKPDFGFGILPMWMGRPDEPGYHPKRGWYFSLTWYYSHYKAAGVEFSYKTGRLKPDWVSSYSQLALEPGVTYELIAESWSKHDDTGEHLAYVQRMKWWKKGEPEPDAWLTLEDTEGCPIPPAESAVALIAHRCQAEFGPVVISRLVAPGPGK